MSAIKRNKYTIYNNNSNAKYTYNILNGYEELYLFIQIV